MLKELIAFLGTFLLAAALLPRLANIASRIGLVDMPNRRKTHGSPKPLVGGLGMAMALAVSCLTFVPLSHLRGFYAGFVLLVIIGFLDDFRELKHGGKFIAQILAALAVVYFSGLSLNTFGDLLGLGPINFGIFAMPVTIFCIVGVINAFNMVDGLDGLAGSISFVAFLSFSVLAQINGQLELGLLAIAFSGAVFAFLCYNRFPARLFMGDAGSLSIGFALGFFSIAITQKPDSVVSPVTSLLILAVPICDTVRIIIARLLKGRSPFLADNKHLHHLLIRTGFNRKRTVRIIVILSSVLAMAAVAGSFLRLPDYFLFALFAIYGSAYFAMAVSIRKIVTAKIRLRKIDSERYGSGGRFMSAVLVLATAAKIIRRERRIALKAPVKGKFMGLILSGTMLDLSMTGFSAVIGHEFSVGDRIEFEIFLTGLPAKLDVTSEVIWTAKAGDERKYGFRIVRISRPEAEFLKVYLENPDIRTSQS